MTKIVKLDYHFTKRTAGVFWYVIYKTINPEMTEVMSVDNASKSLILEEVYTTANNERTHYYSYYKILMPVDKFLRVTVSKAGKTYKKYFNVKDLEISERERKELEVII